MDSASAPPSSQYNGRLFFGVTGDYETIPDVAVVANETVAGINELLELAVARR